MLWQDSRATRSLKDYAYWDIDYIKAGPPEVAWTAASKPGQTCGSAAIATCDMQVFTLHGEKDYAQASGTFLRNGKALHLQDSVSATSHLQCIKPVVIMCYSRVMSPLLYAGTCRNHPYPQEWSASNRSDPSTLESWWLHEVSQWRHTSFIAPCGNVEIWRLRTENWPDRCKTCKTPQSWTAGCCGFI